uniref:Uncharacterized protein n=1 Tax=Anguilla anguilla TaxID=7936 RepID=A0A0E9PMM5_ANGAN
MGRYFKTGYASKKTSECKHINLISRLCSSTIVFHSDSVFNKMSRPNRCLVRRVKFRP